MASFTMKLALCLCAIVVSVQGAALDANAIIKANPKSGLVVNPRPHKVAARSPWEATGNKQDNYQAIQLFTEHGQAGLTATLYHEYCGDLSACFEVNLDNVVSSARVFGIWLFYDGYGYGLNDDDGVAWIWGDDYYYDFAELDNAVSSVRFVGIEDDFLGDSVTLFSGENFKAWEYFIYGDMASLTAWDYLTDSAIITGSSPWTLYQYELYQGQSICVYPQDGGNPGLYPTAQSLSLNTVRSVRKGCFSANKQQKPIKTEKNVFYSSKQFK